MHYSFMSDLRLKILTPHDFSNSHTSKFPLLFQLFEGLMPSCVPHWPSTLLWSKSPPSHCYLLQCTALHTHRVASYVVRGIKLCLADTCPSANTPPDARANKCKRRYEMMFHFSCSSIVTFLACAYRCTSVLILAETQQSPTHR